MLTVLQDVPSKGEAFLAFPAYIPPSSLVKVQFSNISEFGLRGLFNQSLLNIKTTTLNMSLATTNVQIEEKQRLVGSGYFVVFTMRPPPSSAKKLPQSRKAERKTVSNYFPTERRRWAERMPKVFGVILGVSRVFCSFGVLLAFRCLSVAG